MIDAFELQRFIDAQAPVYTQVMSELRSGRKRSHWMWFVFPQIAGLGRSAMAHRYAITSRDEAVAFLEHPTLGPRLLECIRTVCGIPHRTIGGILGSPDDLKFRSSMTLFEAVSGDPIFQNALDRFYAGERDPATLAILKKQSPLEGSER